MNITVLLEPIPTGFRASTGSPLNLTAEAPTADEAIKIVRLQLSVAFARGCRVVDLGEAVTKYTQAWDKLAADPQHEQFVQAMAEYRKERDAEDTGISPNPISAPQPDPAGVAQ